MRPSFLQLGGEDKFADYQREFTKLLPSGLTDFLGNRVTIAGDRCHHVCFKENEKDGPRNQWKQGRAERIPFIKAALEKPNFVCVLDGRTWVFSPPPFS